MNSYALKQYAFLFWQHVLYNCIQIGWPTYWYATMQKPHRTTGGGCGMKWQEIICLTFAQIARLLAVVLHKAMVWARLFAIAGIFPNFARGVSTWISAGWPPTQFLNCKFNQTMHWRNEHYNATLFQNRYVENRGGGQDVFTTLSFPNNNGMCGEMFPFPL